MERDANGHSMKSRRIRRMIARRQLSFRPRQEGASQQRSYSSIDNNENKWKEIAI